MLRSVGLAGLLVAGALVALPVPARAATTSLQVVSVSSWTDADGRLHEVGEVRNPGPQTVAAPTVTLVEGGASHTVAAVLGSLAPGEVSPFASVTQKPAGYTSTTASSAAGTVTSIPPEHHFTTTVTGPSGGASVSGAVTDTDTQTVHLVQVALTFYDGAGRVVDAGSTYLSSGSQSTLAPGAQGSYALTRPSGAPTAVTVRALTEAVDVPASTGAQGCGASAALTTGATAAAAGSLHALTGGRVADTRGGRTDPQSGHTLCGGSSLELQVAGAGGVPTSATGAVLDVTGIGAANGFVTVWPAGTARPAVSQVSYAPGRPQTTTVTIPLGAGGRIAVYAPTTADVQVDVEGWVGPATSDTVHPLTPVRIADTRPGRSLPGSGRTPGAGGVVTLPVAGHGGVPASGATGVLVTLTGTGSTAGSYLTAYPAGATRPVVADVQAPKGGTAANQLLLPLDSTGNLDVYNAAGSTDVLLDVAGWVGPGSGGSTYMAVAPARLLDTRSSGAVASGRTVTVQVTGRAGVPAGATAALTALTAALPPGAGYATAYATGTAEPVVSDLSYATPGSTSAQVLAPLDGSGRTTLVAHGATVQLLLDVVGYLTPA